MNETINNEWVSYKYHSFGYRFLRFNIYSPLKKMEFLSLIIFARNEVDILVELFNLISIYCNSNVKVVDVIMCLGTKHYTVELG